MRQILTSVVPIISGKMGGLTPNNAKIRVVLPAFALILLAQIAIGALAIYAAASHEVKNSLNSTIQRVKADVHYKDGHWDTSKYDTNPEIPGSYRLYFIAKDGFVIDRWRPIPGYLDTSDFKQLSAYSSPRTEQRLERDLADHRLTEDQANKIKAKLEEAKKFYRDIASRPPQERRELLLQKNRGLREWALQNDINASYLRLPTL